MSQPNKLEAKDVDQLTEKLRSSHLGDVPPQDQTVEQSQVEEAERRGAVEVAPVPEKIEDKKETKRRFKTYVFMDLETTASSMPGLSENLDELKKKLSKKFWDYFNRLAGSRNPKDYENHFNCWKKHLVKRWTPTFAEIAFLAVSAEQFEDLITLDKEVIVSAGEDGDIITLDNEEIRSYVQRLSYQERALEMVELDDLKSKDARQMNPDSPYQFYYSMKEKVENEEKVSFQDAWNGENGLGSWLDKLSKPVCLVAHNGFFHDFCVLYCDLKRVNASVPDGVYYADTMIGVRNYQDWYGPKVYGIDLDAKLGLVKLHRKIFDGNKTPYLTYNERFHRALEDCKATLEVVSVFGEKMLQYIDDAAVQLNMTSLQIEDEETDWTQQKMLDILNDNFPEHGRIFVVVKPCRLGVVENITELLQQNDFELVKSKKLIVSEEILQKDKVAKDFYSPFLDYFRSEEVVGMIFQGREKPSDLGRKGNSLLFKDKYYITNHIKVAGKFANREIARWFTFSIDNDKPNYE